MKSTNKVNRPKMRRNYSETFKKARVKDYEEGTFSVAQIGRLYSIHVNILYRWISKYSSYDQQKAIIVEVPNSQTEKVKLLEKRVAELERSLGQKQIKLDYYESFIEELREAGIDVEKKSGFTTPLSGSCRNTDQK
ncbi:transposase [Lewinella sp. LCG006]|uniref:transposase n=1 Tax=Lewinella sp. LCG006 TaxID=3231911 RepID=UPI00346055DF